MVTDTSKIARKVPRRRQSSQTSLACLALWLFSSTAAVAQVTVPQTDLTELSLDDLTQLSISAASKRSEPVFDTPSAVSVLPSAEIERYGFSDVADALRLVPGVQVAANSGEEWSIAVRGFDGITSTKLLVLVDGRTIYSPFYGGVDWSEANMQIQDLDRIEVVRGPGATLWGANAVNGVINIISKSSQDTQGGYLSIREGTTDGSLADFRYGGKLDDRTSYRIYLTASDTRDATSEPDFSGDKYDFKQLRAGFRTDSDWNESLQLTLQGEYADLEHENTTSLPGTTTPTISDYDHRPADLLGRLKWHDSTGDELTVQVYADEDNDSTSPDFYQIPGGNGAFSIVDDGKDFDVDISNRLKLGSANDFLWGGGFRYTLIDLEGFQGSAISTQEPRVIEHLANLFAQDEITLVPQDLRLTIGSKFEHDEFISWQALPSARIAFTPTAQQTWWASASRAIRSPSLSERDARLIYAELPATPFSPPVQVGLNGEAMFHQEDLTAYEVGWRFKPKPSLSFEATAYFNDYNDLRNAAPTTQLQLQPPLIVENLSASNTAKADGYGIEIGAEWHILDDWRISANLTDERLIPQGLNFSQLFAPDYALPHEMASVRSSVLLSHDVQLSLAAYAVSRLEQMEFGVPNVPGYVRTDAQIVWWIRPDLETNLGVQNAFDGAHTEGSNISFNPTTEIPRNFFGQIKWRF